MTGVATLVVLMSPWGRAWLESTMVLHMLVQFPLAILAGALMAVRHRQLSAGGAETFNRYGLSGLCFSAVNLSLLMIPRVLDLAAADTGADLIKLAVLALTGVALHRSLPLAPAVLKGFFLGNVLPMMVVIGALYLQAPQRLCNVYLFDEQRRVGLALISGSMLLAAAWLVRAAMGGSRDAIQRSATPSNVWHQHQRSPQPAGGPAPAPASPRDE